MQMRHQELRHDGASVDDPPTHSDDPAVSRALQLIHTRFAEKLDVHALR